MGPAPVDLGNSAIDMKQAAEVFNAPFPHVSTTIAGCKTINKSRTSYAFVLAISRKERSTPRRALCAPKFKTQSSMPFYI